MSRPLCPPFPNMLDRLYQGLAIFDKEAVDADLHRPLLTIGAGIRRIPERGPEGRPFR